MKVKVIKSFGGISKGTIANVDRMIATDLVVHRKVAEYYTEETEQKKRGRKVKSDDTN